MNEDPYSVDNIDEKPEECFQVNNPLVSTPINSHTKAKDASKYKPVMEDSFDSLLHYVIFSRIPSTNFPDLKFSKIYFLWQIIVL